MQLKLVSFKLCPFVQRAIMTMRYKKIPYDIEFIDIDHPPAWLLELSPLGEVPIMIVDDKEVLFESSVICEFLDDSTPGHLMPEDPLQRAVDRSWIAYAGSALGAVIDIIHAEEEQQAKEATTKLKNRMCWLQNKLQLSPYFNGQQLSLVDFTYAPLFMRMKLLQLDREMGLEQNDPKVAAWANALLDLPVVQGSVVGDFVELLHAHVIERGPYTAQRLGWA